MAAMNSTAGSGMGASGRSLKKSPSPESMAPKKKPSGQVLSKAMIMGTKFLESPNTFSKAKLSDIKGEEIAKSRPSIAITSADKPGESSVEGEDEGEDFTPMQARQKHS